MKFSFGFNQYKQYDRIINGYKTDKYIQYGETEDWLHVIQCPELKKEWEDFIARYKEVVRLSKNIRELEVEAFWFVNDIRDFLNKVNDVGEFQQVIGYKSLF